MIKEEKPMSPTALAKIAAKKKTFNEESKNKVLKAGGSVKTKYAVDAQEVCRDVRGK